MQFITECFRTQVLVPDKDTSTPDLVSHCDYNSQKGQSSNSCIQFEIQELLLFQFQKAFVPVGSPQKLLLCFG